jgi:hypothetical protein
MEWYITMYIYSQVLTWKSDGCTDHVQYTDQYPSWRQFFLTRMTRHSLESIPQSYGYSVWLISCFVELQSCTLRNPGEFCAFLSRIEWVFLFCRVTILCSTEAWRILRFSFEESEFSQSTHVHSCRWKWVLWSCYKVGTVGNSWLQGEGPLVLGLDSKVSNNEMKNLAFLHTCHSSQLDHRNQILFVLLLCSWRHWKKMSLMRMIGMMHFMLF